MKYFNEIVLILVLTTCTGLRDNSNSILRPIPVNGNQQLNTKLIVIYNELQQIHRYAHVRITTYGSDDITTWAGGNKAPFRVFDQLNYGNGENARINWLEQFAWEKWWNIIRNSNEIIDKLDGAIYLKTRSDKNDNQTFGEALFFRALAYFQLVRTFGGVPLILDPFRSMKEEERATVLETYVQIEQDLKRAASLLEHPKEIRQSTRPSFAAANTALARLYMTWAGWPMKDTSKYSQAADQAEKVMNLGYFRLENIDELWSGKMNKDRESIFSLKLRPEATQTLASSFAFHQAGGFSDCFAELQFFRDFPEGPRKEVTFSTWIPVVNNHDQTVDFVPWENSDRGHPGYNKFRTSAQKDSVLDSSIFGYYKLFRYAEVLLIYAEANARIGKVNKGIEALNQVRRRAAGLPVQESDICFDLKTATPDDIVDEAGWELAGENKRWFDLVRTERVREVVLKRDPAEPVPVINYPSALHYIAPIPESAIYNSKLVQNPDGFKVK